MNLIPFVIDNIDHRLADVLNVLLQMQQGQQLDVATAYFSIRGYEQVRHTLPDVRHFRLLLGSEPHSGDAPSGHSGLRPDPATFLRHELNREPLDPQTQALVEELIRFLRRNDVDVRLYLGYDPQMQHNGSKRARRRFLHAKCYLLYGGRGDQQVLFDRLNPLVGIVGSSNFTGPGLTTNRELNLVHKTILAAEEIEDEIARSEVAHHAQGVVNSRISAENQRLLKSEVGARAIIDLARWYDEQWRQAEPYKEQLIDLLENSKFGGREYTPYEIYMKALYEYFRDDLGSDIEQPSTRSAVELTEFQEDAVRKARRILARYDGVIVADSVGLGKTWIGKKLLEDYAYHQRQKALVICPASLRSMWEEELHAAAISARVLSQERLGQPDFETRGLEDVDLILIDEAHNFRNKLTNRYGNLETILAANGRRGRSGGRKKVILLTATPINNNIFDLYNQINLFAGNDRSYFASVGIGDLYKYFLAARRDSIEEGSIRIFNLLEEVVIRRTRHFIRRAYPEATIHGRTITWPERQLRTVRYDLEATYEGFYRQIVRRIEALNLAHYNLESYKELESEQDDFELGRQQALVGIFKSRFLKRLESSIESFRISVRRALEFVKTFDEYVHDDIILDSSSFRTTIQLLHQDDDDDALAESALSENGAGQTLVREDGAGSADALYGTGSAAVGTTPRSRAGEIDEVEEARALVADLPRLDPSAYDRRRLHRALTEDIEHLTEIWHDIRHISMAQDAKLEAFKQLLLNELQGQKVLIFTYYKDTARYLYHALTADQNRDWREQMGYPTIRRIDSDVAPSGRDRIVERFAPVSHDRPELLDTDEEIDILIATDVLSEGQNLQDCGHLINYDLHWNPTRMVQRAGRIDRLGSQFDVLTIYNMFPARELEELLGLVRSLTAKIEVINQTGFLDASVLGEVVTPREFNTLRRIAEEDNAVVEEQESFLELASSEAVMAELQKALASDAGRWITDLDDGIHSGIYREGARGVFFYFAGQREDTDRTHFWRYYDLNRRHIIDNRYEIMQLIACGPETPRYPPPYEEVDIFALQEQVIEDILGDVTQQQSAALVSKPVAEEQVVASQILRQNVRNAAFDRNQIRALRKFLEQPLVGASIRTLRDALRDYSATNDPDLIVMAVQKLYEQQGTQEPVTESSPAPPLTREMLQLICYEYIS